MASTEIKDNVDLKNYIQELNDDIHLSISNLREKSLSVSAIRAKWLAYYFKEKENLERIKKAKAKIISQKTTGIKLNDSVLRMKSEEKIVKEDENVKKLNILSENTKANIDYIERCFNILDDFGFSIKNAIECMKLERS